MWNKIFFENKLSKIKNKTLRNYFKNFFKFKVVILKIISFVLISIFVLSLALSMREWFLHNSANVVLNKGVSFSAFSTLDPTLVKLIQMLPVVIFFIFFIFINDWFIFIFLPLVIFGGLSNFIDRFIIDIPLVVKPNNDGINTVVDYINGFNSVYNIPDIIIITGIVLTVIGFITKIIIINYKEAKKSKNTNYNDEPVVQAKQVQSNKDDEEPNMMLMDEQAKYDLIMHKKEIELEKQESIDYEENDYLISHYESENQELEIDFEDEFNM